MKEVTITKNIKILDSPGIVMTTGSNEAAVVLRNCVKVKSFLCISAFFTSLFFLKLITVCVCVLEMSGFNAHAF